MTKAKTGTARARYTLQFKQEAARLVKGGQRTSGLAAGSDLGAHGRRGAGVFDQCNHLGCNTQ